MKIKIEVSDKDTLKKIRDSINEILNFSDEELDTSEENIKFVKELKDKIYYINFKRARVDIKIVSSAGTELTVM